jgi:hypothetical protein
VLTGRRLIGASRGDLERAMAAGHPFDPAGSTASSPRISLGLPAWSSG